MQIKPRKSKEIQIKRLAFPWIPLVESGPFKGLRRIQIEKFRVANGRVRNAQNAWLCGLGGRQRFDIGHAKTYSIDSDFLEDPRQSFLCAVLQSSSSRSRRRHREGAEGRRGDLAAI
jgi:hypothetical protein